MNMIINTITITQHFLGRYKDISIPNRDRVNMNNKSKELHPRSV